MANLLGLAQGKSGAIESRLRQLRDIENIKLHWYEKELEIPGRKLGHVTVLLQEKDALSRKQEATCILERIRSIWPMP